MRSYSNRFLVTVDDVFTRVDFFDISNGEKVATGGVIMLNSDADQLAECMRTTRAQHEAVKAKKQ